MLEVFNVQKSYLKQLVLNKINLTIKQGEFFSLVGPSGCGKSTLPRIIAGFERQDSGKIDIEGKSIQDLKPQLRPCNIVFQRAALFPHLTVYENIAFGLRVKKVNDSQIATEVQNVLGLIKLSEFANRMPATLSGGQAQRVSLARAIINKPKLLLLDEPMSALDQKLKIAMQYELKELQKQTNITFLMVTHDQSEALSLSDRMAVLNNGVIQQIGTPSEIYEKPFNRFVADFIGESNFIKIKDQLKMIRPEDISLMQSTEYSLPYLCKVQSITFKGERFELLLGHEAEQLKIFASTEVFKEKKLQVGDNLNIYFNQKKFLDMNA